MYLLQKEALVRVRAGWYRRLLEGAPDLTLGEVRRLAVAPEPRRSIMWVSVYLALRSLS